MAAKKNKLYETIVLVVVVFGKYLEKMDGWFYKACALYADTLSKYPEADEIFRKEMPLINDVQWKRMFAVGSGRLIQEAAYWPETINGNMMKMDIAKQMEAITIGLEVLGENENEDKIMRIHPLHLQPRQRSMVFARDHLRSIEEQRAWLANNRMNSYQNRCKFVTNTITYENGTQIVWAPTGVSGKLKPVAIQTGKELRKASKLADATR